LYVNKNKKKIIRKIKIKQHTYRKNKTVPYPLLSEKKCKQKSSGNVYAITRRKKKQKQKKKKTTTTKTRTVYADAIIYSRRVAVADSLPLVSPPVDALFMPLRKGHNGILLGRNHAVAYSPCAPGWWEGVNTR
jgi:hypothetical protein